MPLRSTRLHATIQRLEGRFPVASDGCDTTLLDRRYGRAFGRGRRLQRRGSCICKPKKEQHFLVATDVALPLDLVLAQNRRMRELVLGERLGLRLDASFILGRVALRGLVGDVARRGVVTLGNWVVGVVVTRRASVLLMVVVGVDPHRRGVRGDRGRLWELRLVANVCFDRRAPLHTPSNKVREMPISATRHRRTPTTRRRDEGSDSRRPRRAA
jgi:hypothetical protein